jgi:hypothetical protein
MGAADGMEISDRLLSQLSGNALTTVGRLYIHAPNVAILAISGCENVGIESSKPLTPDRSNNSTLPYIICLGYNRYEVALTGGNDRGFSTRCSDNC